jgi:hypothetical protein
MKFYIRSSNGLEYDNEGISAPYRQMLDFKELVKRHGAKRVSWAHMNGIAANPRVLCFTFESMNDARGAQKELPDGFYIMQHWRS